MLNKLIKKKNLILIFYAFVLVTFLILTLIFGNSEDKFEILIGSLILPFVIYGFLRLMYKIVNINSP